MFHFKTQRVEFAHRLPYKCNDEAVAWYPGNSFKTITTEGKNKKNQQKKYTLHKNTANVKDLYP